jgi:uncharacterized OB-fold protein
MFHKNEDITNYTTEDIDKQTRELNSNKSIYGRPCEQCGRIEA